MKNILSSIIDEAPNLQVLVVGKKSSEKITKEIEEYVSEFGGEISFIPYEAVSFGLNNGKILSVVEENSKDEFLIRGYEVLIILDVFEQQDKKIQFLQKYYHSLENSGNAFILIEKEKYSPWSAKEDLEEANFVAVNDIELDESRVLMYGKKMHGWGGGM